MTTEPDPDPQRTATYARAWVLAATTDTTLILSLAAAQYLNTVPEGVWAQACQLAAVEAGYPFADDLRAAVAVHVGQGVVAGLAPDGSVTTLYVEGLADQDTGGTEAA